MSKYNVKDIEIAMTKEFNQMFNKQSFSEVDSTQYITNKDTLTLRPLQVGWQRDCYSQLQYVEGYTVYKTLSTLQMCHQRFSLLQSSTPKQLM
eukprot:6462740-Amphidinium_carterae.1